MTFHTTRKGTWADSDTEKALKALVAFAKSYGGGKELIDYGHAHLKLFDALKKEFRALRSAWMLLKEQVVIAIENCLIMKDSDGSLNTLSIEIGRYANENDWKLKCCTFYSHL